MSFADFVVAGPEIAALLAEGCIIGSHQIFSEQLEEQLSELPPLMRAASGYAHWMHGSYLITGVLPQLHVHT